MNRNLFFALIASIFLLSISSCSVMNIANPGIEPVVFTKPMHRDTAFTTTFIGAKYSYTHYQNNYDVARANNFGQTYIYQTFTKKYFNASYGALTYVGKINFDDNEPNHPFYTKGKSYYGLGATFDAQLNLPFGRFALRPLGGRFSIMYENGEFARYKEQNTDLYGLINTNYVATCVSQTFGADYYFKNSSLAFNISMGYETLLPSFLFDVGFASNIAFTHKNLTVYIQNSGLLFLANNEFSLGVSYRL